MPLGEGHAMPRRTETLSRTEAFTLMAAAEAEADRIGIPYCLAVVDAAGWLIAFARQDDALAGCIELAMNKAYSASIFRQPTDMLGALSQPGAELYGLQNGQAGRVVIFGGGLPVIRNGQVIGA
ncbi:heme-binding protein, partial [Thioclava sp. BHET1]